MLKKSIVFIGPMGVGKSSAAKAVASALDLEYIDVDEQRWEYFATQPDYNEQVVEQLFNDSRELEAFRYMKPFEARYAVDLLTRFPCGVFDFGAGYTVYENAEWFEAVRNAFSKHEHIIFLRYSGDPEESLAALRERHPDVPMDVYDALNRCFIESPCNEILASHIINTKNKTVQEVADMVIKVVSTLS